MGCPRKTRIQQKFGGGFAHPKIYDPGGQPTGFEDPCRTLITGSINAWRFKMVVVNPPHCVARGTHNLSQCHNRLVWLSVKSTSGRNAFRQAKQVIEAFRRDEGRTFAADYAAAHKQHPAKGVHEQVRPAAEPARHFLFQQCRISSDQLQEATWTGGKT